jgi:hypothetical protein
MSFLKEIRHHLKEFESESSDEIHRFIDFLEGKYLVPVDVPAVPAPAVSLPVPDLGEPTFNAPVAASVAPAAPVVDVDPVPAGTPLVNDAGEVVAVADGNPAQGPEATTDASASTAAPATTDAAAPATDASAAPVASADSTSTPAASA